MRVVFVHGACVRDGSWWWHRTATLLRQHGVSSAPRLPSCGEGGVLGGGGAPGLAEDVAAVRQALVEVSEPTVVVAHSYGGIVTAAAAAGVESVRHLLLVSSYLPEVGQSLSDFGDGGPTPFLDVGPVAGTFGVRPELLVETFLQDCDAHVQEAAVDHLARQNVQVSPRTRHLSQCCGQPWHVGTSSRQMLGEQLAQTAGDTGDDCGAAGLVGSSGRST